MRGKGNKTKFLVGMIILTFMISNLEAQILFQYDSSIQVIENERTLNNAWAGGLNSGQYGKLDINGDQEEDLVIFERSSRQLKAFLNLDGQYIFHPAYRSFFPDDIEGWILFRDYDCDGRKDIFANTERGMKVYRNVTEQGSYLEWELIADPVLTLTNSGVINLQVNITDVPGIDDVDGDGDLDILVYNFAIGGFIRYHQNMSVEKSGSCGLLDYELVNRNWGDFEECECYYAFLEFGQSCPSISGGRVMHPGGKSITLIDMDNDGDKDFLGGHEQCVELFYLENEGSPEEALMLSYSDTFPDPDKPANMFIHPAAFLEDFDMDGRKDMIVAPNEQDNIDNRINFSHSSWFYKNTGTNENPEFAFVTDQFLQSDMIDLGDHAVPSLVDFDGDGDMDLMVGGNGKKIEDHFYAYLRVYENVGNAIQPVFQLIDNDYLDISALRHINPIPRFADLDHDGAIDLVLITFDPISGETGIRWLKNKNTAGRGLDFDLSEFIQLDLDIRFGDTPIFTDVNEDGLNDMLLGKSSGRLEYYSNAGTLSDPVFRLEEAAFLGIDDDFITFKRNLVPFVFDFDKDGRDDLLTTDYTGVLTVYRHYKDDPDKLYQVIRNPLTELTDTAAFGYHTWLTGGNLILNEFPVLITGSLSGGLIFYRNPESPDNSDKQDLTLKIYPNPLISRGPLNILSNEDGWLYIYNAIGQQIENPVQINAYQTAQFEFVFIRQGIYLFKMVSNSGRSVTHRLVVY